MESAASSRFWQLLLEAPVAPSQPVHAVTRALDDEFDFLAETVEPAPAMQVVAAGSPDPARLARLAELDADLTTIASELTLDAERLRHDARLDALDPAALLYLCKVLVLLPGGVVSEHGALTRVLQRAARSPDPALVVAAADAIGHLHAHGAQLELIARLHADPTSLGHAGVDRVLAALKLVADGRCVRQMEALLVERGAVLSDVHAYQARHIVQVIRRAGRK